MQDRFPEWYDWFMEPLEKRSFQRIRKQLISKANGKVLEIGSGTGINFPLYTHANNVVAIEPNPYMIQRSLTNKRKAVIPIEIVQMGAENLPFNDHSFDTIVATLVFCTISDVDKAIQEMKRICKPNGRILLFEHVKMDEPFLANLQVYLTPFWKKICDGCCLDRETVLVMKEKGFNIIELKKFYRGLFVTMEIQNEGRLD